MKAKNYMRTLSLLVYESLYHRRVEFLSSPALFLVSFTCMNSLAHTNRAEIWATKHEWLLFAKNNNYIAPRIDVCSHSSALAGFNVFNKWHWEY